MQRLTARIRLCLLYTNQVRQSTSDVTNALTDSFKELEGKYKGLSITPLSNQGDFIKLSFPVF